MYKKISTDELEVGMHVCGIEKKAGDASFFMNNILIKNKEDIKKLRESGCTAVYIGTAPPDGVSAAPPDDASTAPIEESAAPLPAGVDTPPPDDVSAAPPDDASAAPPEESTAPLPAGEEKAGGVIPAESKAPDDVDADVVAETLSAAVESSLDQRPIEDKDPVEFEEEIEEARETRKEAEIVIKDLMQDVRLGRSIDKDKVYDTVGKIIDSVFKNKDAITSLTRLKNFDHYTFTHSINVCTLSIALGRWVSLEKEDIHSLGVGALLHDVGKMLIPEVLLNKRGSYTDDEFRQMQQHPVLGADFLSGTRALGDGSMQVVLQHHERHNGSGYPAELAGDKIHLFACIAGIADVYDAMTSDRVYRSMIAPNEVLKLLYVNRETEFGPGLVEKFIQCIGIYPIGSLVELNTGEIALIRSIDRSHLLQPVLVIILDENKKSLAMPLVVNLNSDDKRCIVGAADPNKYKFNFDQFLT